MASNSSTLPLTTRAGVRRTDPEVCCATGATVLSVGMPRPFGPALSATRSLRKISKSLARSVAFSLTAAVSGSFSSALAASSSWAAVMPMDDMLMFFSSLPCDTALRCTDPLGAVKTPSSAPSMRAVTSLDTSLKASARPMATDTPTEPNEPATEAAAATELMSEASLARTVTLAALTPSVAPSPSMAAASAVLMRFSV